MTTETNTAAAPAISPVVKLSKPLVTHKGTVEEITLREPTARSYIRAGKDPFTVKATPDGVTTITYDIPATMAFLSEITGIDSLLLESLNARDFLALRDRMAYLAMLGAGDNRDPSVA